MKRVSKKDVQSNLKAAKKEARAAKKTRTDSPPSNALLVGARVLFLLIVLGMGYATAAGHYLYSEVEQRVHIVPRLLFFVLSQAAATELFVVLLLQVARRLCGDEGAVSCEPTPKEMAVHDPSIPWPAAEHLAGELKPFLERPGQPFFLNHVTARQRCKDAFVRTGMNLGSLVAVCCTCWWMDGRDVASIGLALDRRLLVDSATGFAVGITIVGFIFIVELLAGWIHFLQFFEVFDKSERFSACIFWDVVFHLNVAFNEELPLRGWMLHNMADACVAHFDFAPLPAFFVAVVAESAFFVLMHLRSPGGSQFQSMLNLFVGGVSGGLNVMLTGGRLGFALGWHFGWNISMGNVFGLSTSGIPISGTFVAVAPHPEKQALHGGVFGPEGGLVAPAAYCLGVALLASAYGVPRSAAELGLQ
mmetsp:Transcript_15235/g.44573  ORF Transcript_15235/g.44573 Transcript_15235/m.44573 type:complete len:418 (+) Transcript_15235:127-1380(+)